MRISDWSSDVCSSDLVNEQAAINRESVRDAFARRNIEVLVGDWTTGDPAISRFLDSMGRSGVPLYMFYPGDGGEPQILPQLLTPPCWSSLAAKAWRRIRVCRPPMSRSPASAAARTPGSRKYLGRRG